MHSHLVCLVLFAAFATTLGQHDHHNHEHHRINVGVYYESLCPDSRKFFTQQLYPTLQGELRNYVNLTLVPFGKSRETSEDVFECHHGPRECDGNKIQACAIKKIEGNQNSKDLGFNKVTVDFINCLMDKTIRNKTADYVSFPTTECATQNHVSDVNMIENCANHNDGSTYLSELGKLTNRLQNPLESVPTVVFNNQYKKDDVKLAQNNFVKALCQYIQGDKPAECSKSGADSLKINALAVAVAAIVLRYLY